MSQASRNNLILFSKDFQSFPHGTSKNKSQSMHSQSNRTQQIYSHTNKCTILRIFQYNVQLSWNFLSHDDTLLPSKSHVTGSRIKLAFMSSQSSLLVALTYIRNKIQTKCNNVNINTVTRLHTCQEFLMEQWHIFVK